MKHEFSNSQSFLDEIDIYPICVRCIDSIRVVSNCTCLVELPSNVKKILADVCELSSVRDLDRPRIAMNIIFSRSDLVSLSLQIDSQDPSRLICETYVIPSSIEELCPVHPILGCDARSPSHRSQKPPLDYTL